MTIEERAKQYTGNVMYEACFIDGAIEQREIDIEKACEWLRENVRPYYKFNIESFRKAMEEEQ